MDVGGGHQAGIVVESVVVESVVVDVTDAASIVVAVEYIEMVALV